MASIRDLIIRVTERKNGNALVEAARELDGLSHGVDASAASMKKAESDAKRLNTELEKTTARIKDLHKQYAATGDDSLFKDIRKEEQRARNLTKSLKSLFSDGGNQSGNAFTRAFSSAIDAGAEGIKPMHGLIAALVLAIVAATPALGAALAGALTGAAAIAGIAGGIFAASKDPTVRAAAQDFGSTISGEFFSSGSSFVDPIRESLAILAADFQKLDLGTAFAKVAPYVTTIARGIGDLALNFMPGFNKALERAGPFVNATARGLADFGTALGDLLDRSSASHGAVEGLGFAFAFVNVNVIGLGNTVHWLSDVFHNMNEKAASAVDGVANFIEKASWVDNLLPGWHKFAQQIRDFANKDIPLGAKYVDEFGHALDYASINAKKMADNTKSASDAIDAYVNNALAASNATIAVAQDFADLNDKLIRGKGNWDNNTQAGRDNNKLINDTIADLERQRQQAITTGHGTEQAIRDADKAYDEQLAKLLGIAANAGLAKDKVEALAGTYYIKIFTIEDRVQLNQQNKAAAVDAAINRLAGYRASGGPVKAGLRYRVGENGAEDFVPSQNGYIDPNAGGQSGGGVTQVEFVGNTNSAFATFFMKLVRNGDIVIRTA